MKGGDRIIAPSDMALPVCAVPLSVGPLLIKNAAATFPITNRFGHAIRVLRVESMVTVVPSTGDVTVTVKNHGAAATLGTLTITQSGSAVGDKDTTGELAQTDNNIIAEGEDVCLVVDGAADAGEAVYTIWCVPCYDNG